MNPDLSPSEKPAEASARAGLRILHVAECYEAGVGHAVDTLVRIRSHDVNYLLYAGARPPSDGFQNSQSLPSGFLRRIRGVRAAVRHHQPDIVHLHSSWAGVYGRLAFLDVPIVYQPHCFKFDDPTLSRLKSMVFRSAERFLGPLSRVVLTLSQHETSLARKINPSAECVLLPNAPTVPVSHAHKELGRDTVKRIVMVGRLSPQKDPALFAILADAVRTLHDDAEFVWIGDGDAALKSQLESAGVRVTGWLTSSALTDVLDSAACYVHTARYEGFPLSVLDAAARGLPIVARSIPAFEGTGLLQGGDVQTLTDHVAKVLGDPLYFDRAREVNTHLLAEMNETKQEQALETAYKTAMGSKS